MDSELFYNTPIFQDTKYCDCEECKGTGRVYDYIEDQLVREDCPECGGTGQLEME